jgi:hypothetical protein
MARLTADARDGSGQHAPGLRNPSVAGAEASRDGKRLPPRTEPDPALVRLTFQQNCPGGRQNGLSPRRVPRAGVGTALMRSCASVAVVLSVLAVPAPADAQADFQVSRISTPPVIDGKLTDEAWNEAPLDLDRWISYNPLRGEPMVFKTAVRIVHDSGFIYFAFHCFDTEPSKIRTTISRRDNVFNDDWIALSLDSTGTGQTAYHLFVNPSGIQMDALNTASGETATSSRSGCRCRPSGFRVASK